MNRITVLNAIALEDAALTAEELATACSVHTRWVVERAEAGLLGSVTATTVTTTVSTLRFHSAELRRARRLLALERDFDANPELAALAVDGIVPAPRALLRLEHHLEQMRGDEPVGRFQRSALGSAQGFDLLEDVGDIERVEMAGPQKTRLLTRPRIEVRLVEASVDGSLIHDDPSFSTPRTGL